MGFMILIGIVVGALNGNIPKVSNAAINSSKEAVSLCVTMLGIMAMWTGSDAGGKKMWFSGINDKVIKTNYSFPFPRFAKGACGK